MMMFHKKYDLFEFACLLVTRVLHYGKLLTSRSRDCEFASDSRTFVLDITVINFHAALELVALMITLIQAFLI